MTSDTDAVSDATDVPRTGAPSGSDPVTPAEGTEGIFAELEADASTDATDAAPPPNLARHRVVAVMVAHDGLPWIDRALDALDAQERPPARVYVVDTGSTDGTAPLLADRVGPGVESLPRGTGFGAAVAHVLDADRRGPGLPVDPEAEGELVDWVWLLHDDCAPEPDALRQLLLAVEASPSVAVVGPKVLGWADPRHLLEVGVTIARSGARDTGLERHEQDQGQHDKQRSMLAVSTAGMLVRRDVWDELGGLDPNLTIFRDDVDFCWRVNAAGHRVLVVPDAVVHHAEAATHRRRHIDLGPDQPHRLDRQHAMFVLLANMPAWLLPWTLLRLVVGTLARALAFLVGKDPGFALAEVRALGATLAHPRAITAARAVRKRTRVVAYRDLRGLLAAPGTQLRHGAEIVGTLFGADTRHPARLGAGRAPSEPTGGEASDDDGPDDLLAGADSVVRRTLRRPGVVMVLVVLALTLLAERSLIGAGRLFGGTLLPAPGGAHDLWTTYTAWWHPVGVGSPTPAAGYVPILAVVSFVLLGKAALLVDLILLLCVPLAATTAYLAMRGLVNSLVLRLWAAVTYAVLPAATGAVAGGRLGTALVLILLPVLARPALRLAGVLDPAPTWRTAWGTGLLLALLVAFVPGLWVAAALLAVAAAATTARGRRSSLLLVAALAVAPIVLLPWTGQLLVHPSYLLVEGGVVTPSATAASSDPLASLVLGPGGPGTPALWVGLGVVLAAVAAAVRGTRARAVTVACTVGLVALALAVMVAWIAVRTPQLSASVPGWSGAFLVVAAGGLVVAAAIGAEGARDVLAGRSFGWVQPVAVVIVALSVLGPLVALLGWTVRGADDPVRRGAPSALPAFVAADSRTPARPRTLALRVDGTGVVSFSVIRGEGATLGDAEVAPAAEVTPNLDTVVSDLTSGRGGVAGSALIGYGVRYVIVPAPGSRSLERTLDGAPGLRRLSSGEGDAVWRVVGPTGRALLVPTKGAPVLVPSQEVTVNAPLPPTWPGGTLRLAEAADSGWRASVDGTSLKPSVVDGWAQGFTVPAGHGTLAVEYRAPARSRWLVLQGFAFVVVVVLALPSLRREGEGEDA